MNSRESQWNRREFLTGLSSAALLGLGTGLAGCASPNVATSSKTAKRKKVALIMTVVRKLSHGQHFLDRFTEGYGWESRHHHSDVDLASVYVDQKPAGDLTMERESRFHFPVYPTVEEALTLSGSKLAVDGVVIVA